MKHSVKNLPLILAAATCALSLIVMVLALTIPQQTHPEFTPPPFEENAVVGMPDVPENLGWTPVNTPNFSASVCGSIIPTDETVDVWLYNSAENTVWLKLRVLDADGRILGETGLLKPGEYVRSVTLTNKPNPGSQITLKLMAYEPQTYHSEGSASLKTVISE